MKHWRGGVEYFFNTVVSGRMKHWCDSVEYAFNYRSAEWNIVVSARDTLLITVPAEWNIGVAARNTLLNAVIFL